MIQGVGTDIVEIDRMARAVKRPAFLRKCFTAAEIARCEASGAKSAQNFAGYFAAKESVAKALGTGFRGISPRDIEICHNNVGKPFASIASNAAIGAGLRCEISISHGRDHAVAFAVIFKE